MALRDPSLVEQTVGSFDMGGVVQSSTVAKGLQRIYGDGEFHFITCSCHDRRPFLRFAHRRDIFLQILEEVRQSRDKHIAKLCYIHRNPVRRGLVEKPEDWEWSSYRFYAKGIKGPVKLNE